MSPNTDRSTSTPSPLPPLPAGLQKGMVGKDYQPPAAGGSKKASGGKSAASSTITSINLDQLPQQQQQHQPHQQHQLATITLTPMSTLTGTLPTKKDARVSSPFGSASQRVSSPSPILTITPSEGPIPARHKEPAGSRKTKGKGKAGNAAGQQSRPTPYSRPVHSHQAAISQLGVPGLSIEPVLVQPPMAGGSKPATGVNVNRTDKTLPTAAGLGVGAGSLPKDLLASYAELLQKYPTMARSLLMSMKGGDRTTQQTATGGGGGGGGGRKQSAKQSNKASSTNTMAMQAAMVSMAAAAGTGAGGSSGSGPVGPAGGSRFTASPTTTTGGMPRISATITPVTSGAFQAEGYSRGAKPAIGSRMMSLLYVMESNRRTSSAKSTNGAFESFLPF